jgi:hypothetical protein
MWCDIDLTLGRHVRMIASLLARCATKLTFERLECGGYVALIRVVHRLHVRFWMLSQL